MSVVFHESAFEIKSERTMELFSKYESIRQYQDNDTEGKINF